MELSLWEKKLIMQNPEQTPEYCELQNVERLIRNDYWGLKQWQKKGKWQNWRKLPEKKQNLTSSYKILPYFS